MAVNATLCRWSCRSTCQLQRRVSALRGPVLETELHRLCAYTVCLGGFNSNSHNGLISPSLRLPSVLSYKTGKHCKNCSFCSFMQTWDEKCNDFTLLRTSEYSSCFAASHRTPSLAHMFICTPHIPPFVMSCFIPASITQLPLSLGIAYRLITFQEFNVMTGGQANFWGDKWWAKWLQSTGRQMVLELLTEVAPTFSVMTFSDNVKEKTKTATKHASKKQRHESARMRLLLLFL